MIDPSLIQKHEIAQLVGALSPGQYKMQIAGQISLQINTLNPKCCCASAEVAPAFKSQGKPPLMWAVNLR